MEIKYRKTFVSLSKTKRLIKQFCGVSYKKEVQINHSKFSKLNKEFRE